LIPELPHQAHRPNYDEAIHYGIHYGGRPMLYIKAIALEG
jgi:hypothetical protein